jgi:TolB protein
MQIPPPSNNTSRGPLIILLIAAVMILGGAIALAAWGIGQASAPRPTTAPSLDQTTTPITLDISTTNRLAVIDGQRIYTSDPDGGRLVPIEVPGTIAIGSLIWSRAGDRLIYADVDNRSGHVISVRPDGSDQRILYEAGSDAAPFYLSSSPDDQHVAFLASASNGLNLFVADTFQASPAQLVANGQPNYFSWSPQGQDLLLHIGGTSRGAFIGSYRLGDDAPVKIASSPAAFQAPAWSPTGGRQWLYARQSGDTGQLIVGDGAHENQIATFLSGIIFSWSPDAQHIAFATAPSNSLYTDLTIVDPQGNEPHIVYNGELLAFFWSPDSRRLAYLTGAIVQPGPVGRTAGLAANRLAQSTTINFTWHVIDLQTDESIDLNSFEPTDSLLYLVQYFDQFAQSITLWSPDGQSLVYAGKPLVGQSGVYVIDAARPGAAPRYVGPGEFAIWSWH